MIKSLLPNEVEWRIWAGEEVDLFVKPTHFPCLAVSFADSSYYIYLEDFEG